MSTAESPSTDTQVPTAIQVPGIYVEPPPPSPATQAQPEFARPPREVAVATENSHPANELSVKRWLGKDLQWVEDERQTRSALAISQVEIFIGDPNPASSNAPAAPLTVAGTIRANGLAVAGPAGSTTSPMSLSGLPPIAAAPEGAVLRPVYIDPNTGQLYLG